MCEVALKNYVCKRAPLEVEIKNPHREGNNKASERMYINGGQNEKILSKLVMYITFYLLNTST